MGEYQGMIVADTLHREVEIQVYQHYNESQSYEQLLGEVAGYLIKSHSTVAREVTISRLDSEIRRVLKEAGHRWGEVA